MKNSQLYVLQVLLKIPVDVLLINDDVQNIVLNGMQGRTNKWWTKQNISQRNEKVRPRRPKSIKCKLNENSLPYQSEKMLIKVKSWVFFCDALHHVLEKCKVFPLSVFCLAACVMQSLTRGWKQ